MQPRNRGNSTGNGDDSKIYPLDSTSLAKKETSEVIIKPLKVPDGSRFKGYQTFTIQDMGLVAKDVVYKLEVWQSPNGDILRGTLPDELNGQHFGSTLRAFTANLYAQGMTQPAIHEFLRSIGVDLSSGQVNNILLNEAEKYSAVSEEILTAGLQEAPHIGADDTGEKHKHKNGYCTYKVREAIWHLYQELKEASLKQVGKENVYKLYDALVAMQTSGPEVNAVIGNFSTYREEMLKALDHPRLPVHNNDSERDIRSIAKRRNISGSTKSDLGRKFRDRLQSIKQTCFRVGYNFWDYMQRWFCGDPPDLAELVRQRYRLSTFEKVIVLPQICDSLKSYGMAVFRRKTPKDSHNFLRTYPYIPDYFFQLY